MGAVLDRSPSIGVRGEATLGVPEGLGFRDVDVIGCPSMFMWGDALRVERKVPALDARSRVAITISPYRRAMGPIALDRAGSLSAPDLCRAGPRHAQPARRRDPARRRHAGLAAAAPPGSPAVPGAPDTVLHRSVVLDRRPPPRRLRVRIPHPWRDRLARSGHARNRARPRLAHARARPLLRPSRTACCATCAIRSIRHDLYQEADFAALHAGHRERLATFREFLERCRLDHVFAHDGAAAAFERQIAMTPFGGAVVGRDPFGDAADMSAAARRLRSRARRLALSPGGRRVRASLRVPHR